MKIQNAVICDEIRKEENGKLLLIGVYPYDILVSEFPVHIPLTLWVQLLLEQDGKYDVEFRIKKNGSFSHTGRAQIKVGNHLQPVAFSLPPVLIEVDNECNLSFQMRLQNGRWKTLKEIPVKKRPDTN